MIRLKGVSVTPTATKSSMDFSLITCQDNVQRGKCLTFSIRLFGLKSSFLPTEYITLDKLLHNLQYFCCHQNEVNNKYLHLIVLSV